MNTYPLVDWSTDRLSVYFPPSIHHDLLVLSADNSIMVIFRPEAPVREIEVVLNHLIAQYGGDSLDYPILRRSRVSYIVELPRRLQKVLF